MSNINWLANQSNERHSILRCKVYITDWTKKFYSA